MRRETALWGHGIGTRRVLVAALVSLFGGAALVIGALMGARTPHDWMVIAVITACFAGAGFGVYLVTSGLHVVGIARALTPAWRRGLRTAYRSWRFWAFLVSYALIGSAVPADTPWWQRLTQVFAVVTLAWLLLVPLSSGLAAALALAFGLPLKVVRLPSPAENERVYPIFSRLAAAIGLDYVPLLLIVRSSLASALATPSLVMVTEGLLPAIDRAGRERALEALLAHEFTHVAKRHSDRAIDLFLVAGVGFFAAWELMEWAFGAFVSNPSASGSFELFATFLFGVLFALPLVRRFNREQQDLERDADEGAFELGYADDVRFLLSHVLAAEPAASRLARLWPSTHPSRTQRIAAASKYEAEQRSGRSR